VAGQDTLVGGNTNMAQPIQVPQVQPNAPQFQVPTDLINAYMQRRQGDQRMLLGASEDLGNAVNTLHQQKIQNQLAALGAVSQLYAAGGPRAVGQYAPTINQATGTQTIPTQTPPEAAIPKQGTPQNATLPPNQDQSPSPFIQASLAAGHPDVAGVGSFHAPQPSPADLQDIQSGGTYGRNKAQSFKDLGDLAMQPITAQQKGIDIQKGQNDLALYPTEKSLKEQQLINAQQQIPMEQKKTVASEISKEGQSSQQIGQIRQLYTDLEGALAKNKPGLGSTLSGKLNQASGGRIGSTEAADVLNAANPLATALNTELSRRFNSEEVKFLTHALIPSPMDTPDYAKAKMMRLNHMIQSMESGNEQNVKNVANAITGGNINTTIMPTKTQPIGGAKTPQIGQVHKGYVFIGGDPSKPESWKKQ
jgi:hypothetical protein